MKVCQITDKYFIVEAFTTDTHRLVTAPFRQKLSLLNKIFIYTFLHAEYSGCTIHYVNEKIDGGEIIKQKSIKILDSDDKNSLKKKILMEEHKLYIKVLKKLEKIYGKSKQ